MITKNSAHQGLCQLLASELRFQTIERFSADISDFGGIHSTSLVSGTRDACFALSELGVLSCDELGYYRPVGPRQEIFRWMEGRTYTRHEQDILLRGVCHLWASFLSVDFRYDASLASMDSDLSTAFQSAGFVKYIGWRYRWSTDALPWLIEANLADLSEIRATPLKDGALIVEAMPNVDVQRYTELVTRYPRRGLCLICANWNGSSWKSQGHSFIQPNSNWKLEQAKSALDLLLSDRRLS